ncbi:globin [Bradyrhizobium campsiandrae]|uniref:globin n=1 Tax=Bradyrhizobium campsiandrae TaxID=1729892 RepID=UPI001FCED852|nr:globin [Bradyrhizobium campsiandrae]
MNASCNLIEQSFELAAARCAHLAPLVHQPLFKDHPEARATFLAQGSELVMGSMLALTIETILDFADERRGHYRLIGCEVASHDAYGTPRFALRRFVAEHCARMRAVEAFAGIAA